MLSVPAFQTSHGRADGASGPKAEVRLDVNFDRIHLHRHEFGARERAKGAARWVEWSEDPMG